MMMTTYHHHRRRRRRQRRQCRVLVTLLLLLLLLPTLLLLLSSLLLGAADAASAGAARSRCRGAYVPRHSSGSSSSSFADDDEQVRGGAVVSAEEASAAATRTQPSDPCGPHSGSGTWGKRVAGPGMFYRRRHVLVPLRRLRPQPSTGDVSSAAAAAAAARWSDDGNIDDGNIDVVAAPRQDAEGGSYGGQVPAIGRDDDACDAAPVFPFRPRRWAPRASWTRGGGGGSGAAVVHASTGGGPLQRHPRQRDGNSKRRTTRRQQQQQQPLGLLDVTLALRGGGGSAFEGEEDGEAGPSVGGSSSSSTSSSDGYELLGDLLVFRGWRNVVERTVRYPSGQIVHFHLTEQSGASNRAVLVLAWDRSTRTCTLVREYMPSRHRLVTGLAAGMVEDHLHGHGGGSNVTSTDDGFLDPRTVADSARRELAEECRLVGGTWYALTPFDGVVLDKYCTTRLHAYLVIDAAPLQNDDETVPHEHHRDDAEEGMQVISGTTLEQLQQWIREGELTAVGAWGAMLALDMLRHLEEI